MSLLSNIKKYIRYKSFIKRIKEQLPNYHPDYGTPLEWKVYLQRTILKFDAKTGEPTYSKELPKLIIKQKPDSLSHDDSVYGFDWKKKTVYTIPNRKWR